VIVPLTEWKERYEVAPWLVQVEPDRHNGLDNISAADAFQIRSVSQAHFVWRLGKVSADYMDGISRAIQVVISA
jgi:mRNA interferase MazF